MIEKVFHRRGTFGENSAQPPSFPALEGSPGQWDSTKLKINDLSQQFWYVDATDRIVFLRDSGW